MFDFTSDMLTRLRNASRTKHDLVLVPPTRTTRSIAEVLKKENFIEDFQEYTNKEDNINFLLIILKYYEKGRERQSAITHIERVSKPGLRVYFNANKLRALNMPLSAGGMISIVSTSKGIMTSPQAKVLGIGGEILFDIG
jgi:small subunit ribosomal protein S8